MKRDLSTYLESWSNSSSRRPLLIRGARQVGKSFVVREFGRSHFRNVVELNFELAPQLKSIFTTLDPAEITRVISLTQGVEILASHTLLFLDEIQECPQAISSLRYFYELMPDLHVIAAGSLLDFALDSENLHMPVGRVQYLHLQPMSFGEFLVAKGEPGLRSYLSELSVSHEVVEAARIKLENSFREYTIVGGMPAVVSEYLKSPTDFSFQNIQTLLLQTFRDDFGKYASRSKYKYLDKVFSALPALVGERIKYSAIDPDSVSRDIKEAILLLQKARIVYRVRSTSGHGLPLAASADDRRFKAVFIDTGLLQRSLGLSSKLALEKDLLTINSGAIAEQVVGQELLALGNPYEDRELYFWARETKGSNAEVDYLFPFEGEVLPIEVKSGTTGRLTSLRLFREQHNSRMSVRISQLPLSYHDKILSVPFYAIEQLPRLIQACREL